MAKTFRSSAGKRFFNQIMRGVIRLGLGPQHYYVLTVMGRKSGRLYSTPVGLIIEGDQRWLVSPYGEVSWVLNARAAGQVTLARGGRSETVRITEVGPEASAPVLKKYIAKEPITRPYFDAQTDSSLEAFIAEAARHPVFLLQS
jgi:deazaflavin-dependent oxidoreductase (nitroreductase family)